MTKKPNFLDRLYESMSAAITLGKKFNARGDRIWLKLVARRRRQLERYDSR